MPVETNKGLVGVVNAIKVIARDALRCRWIVGALTKLENLKAEVVAATTDLANHNKEIARYTYRLSKVDPADPDAADTTKTLTEEIADLNKSTPDFQKVIDDANKAVADQTTHINDIESGKEKVNIDELNELSKTLIVARAEEDAKSVEA